MPEKLFASWIVFFSRDTFSIQQGTPCRYLSISIYIYIYIYIHTYIHIHIHIYPSIHPSVLPTESWHVGETSHGAARLGRHHASPLGHLGHLGPDPKKTGETIGKKTSWHGEFSLEKMEDETEAHVFSCVSSIAEHFKPQDGNTLGSPLRFLWGFHPLTWM